MAARFMSPSAEDDRLDIAHETVRDDSDLEAGFGLLNGKTPTSSQCFTVLYCYSSLDRQLGARLFLGFTVLPVLPFYQTEEVAQRQEAGRNHCPFRRATTSSMRRFPTRALNRGRRLSSVTRLAASRDNASRAALQPGSSGLKLALTGIHTPIPHPRCQSVGFDATVQRSINPIVTLPD